VIVYLAPYVVRVEFTVNHKYCTSIYWLSLPTLLPLVTFSAGLNDSTADSSAWGY